MHVPSGEEEKNFLGYQGGRLSIFFAKKNGYLLLYKEKGEQIALCWEVLSRRHQCHGEKDNMGNNMIEGESQYIRFSRPENFTYKKLRAPMHETHPL